MTSTLFIRGEMEPEKAKEEGARDASSYADFAFALFLPDVQTYFDNANGQVGNLFPSHHESGASEENLRPTQSLFLFSSLQTVEQTTTGTQGSTHNLLPVIVDTYTFRTSPLPPAQASLLQC